MIELFSLPYVLGAAFVITALAVAYAALTRQSLPLVGSERGALIAVAVLGMTGCAIGGISQEPGVLVNPSIELGWIHPMFILASVLGVTALLAIAAGLLGWDAVHQPLAAVRARRRWDGTSTIHVATFAPAALIALNWLISTTMAVFAHRSGRFQLKRITDANAGQAAPGQDRAVAAHASAHPRAGRWLASVGRGSRPVKWCRRRPSRLPRLRPLAPIFTQRIRPLFGRFRSVGCVRRARERG